MFSKHCFLGKYTFRIIKFGCRSKKSEGKHWESNKFSNKLLLHLWDLKMFHISWWDLNFCMLYGRINSVCTTVIKMIKSQEYNNSDMHHWVKNTYIGHSGKRRKFYFQTYGLWATSWPNKYDYPGLPNALLLDMAKSFCLSAFQAVAWAASGAEDRRQATAFYCAEQCICHLSHNAARSSFYHKQAGKQLFAVPSWVSTVSHSVQ